MLENLALCNGTAILPAAFSIACNCFENVSSFVVSWAGANHTWNIELVKHLTLILLSLRSGFGDTIDNQSNILDCISGK